MSSYTLPHHVTRFGKRLHDDVQLGISPMADIDITQPVQIDDVQPEINNDEEEESKVC